MKSVEAHRQATGEAASLPGRRAGVASAAATNADVARPASGVDRDEVDLILEQWRAERPDLDPSPMGVFGRVARIAARSRSRLARLLEAHQLSVASFDVLANLRRSGRPHRKTPTELAASSMLTSGGITFRLDRLEDKGLIRRVPSTEDRRVTYAELTPEGRALIDRVIAEHIAQEEAMLALLAVGDRQRLADLLRALERSVVASR